MTEEKQWELIGQIEGVICNPLLAPSTRIISVDYLLRKYKEIDTGIQNCRGCIYAYADMCDLKEKCKTQGTQRGEK